MMIVFLKDFHEFVCLWLWWEIVFGSVPQGVLHGTRLLLELCDFSVLDASSMPELKTTLQKMNDMPQLRFYTLL